MANSNGPNDPNDKTATDGPEEDELSEVGADTDTDADTDADADLEEDAEELEEGEAPLTAPLGPVEPVNGTPRQEESQEEEYSLEQEIWDLGKRIYDLEQQVKIMHGDILRLRARVTPSFLHQILERASVYWKERKSGIRRYV